VPSQRGKKKSPKKTLPPKPCRRCGISFVPKRKDQVYCSKACRKADYKDKYGFYKEVTKTCPVCGESFDTTMAAKQTYCSPECREKNRKMKLDEAAARLEAEVQTHRQEVLDTLKRDGYACTKCGRGPGGVDLTVVPDGSRLKTLCVECERLGN